MSERRPGILDYGTSLYSYQAMRNLSALGTTRPFAIPGQGILHQASMKLHGLTGGSTPIVSNYLIPGMHHTAAAATKQVGTFALAKQAVGIKSATTAGTVLAGKQLEFGFTKGILANQLTRKMAAKALVGRVAGTAIGALSAYYLYTLPIQAAFQGYSAVSQAVEHHRGLELGGYFPESRMSLTSRQRTVEAISSSRLQARSAIGNEAFLMHR